MISFAVRGAAALARLSRVTQVTAKVAANPLARLVGETVVLGVAIDFAVDSYTARNELRDRFEYMLLRRQKERAARKEIRAVAKLGEDPWATPAKENPKLTVVSEKEIPVKKSWIKRTGISFTGGVTRTFRFIYRTGKWLMNSIIRNILLIPSFVGFVTAMTLDLVIVLVSLLTIAVVILFFPQHTMKILGFFTSIIRVINNVLYRWIIKLSVKFDLHLIDALDGTKVWSRKANSYRMIQNAQKRAVKSWDTDNKLTQNREETQRRADEAKAVRVAATKASDEANRVNALAKKAQEQALKNGHNTVVETKPLIAPEPSSKGDQPFTQKSHTPPAKKVTPEKK